MAYNILGVNPSHNGSICVLSNGKIIFYLEEERLTRKKYDELPIQSLLYVLNHYEITDVAIAGINLYKTPSSYFGEYIENLIFRKLGFLQKNIHDFSSYHHLTHVSSAFYNSGFDKAIGIVIDAGGSQLTENTIETDTIFYCSYPSFFNTLFQNTSDISLPHNILSLGIGQSFEQLCRALGFSGLDGGKIMGLSSYGNYNPNFSNLFYKNRTNPKYINEEKSYRDFFPKNYIPKWHYNPDFITNLEKDISWKIQNGAQNILGDYIEEVIKITQLNNIVIAGGFGLNCVSNFYLKKRFPNVKFYFEPIAHEGGTSIGAAKLLYHQKTQDKVIRPQKTLYYGPKYSKNQLLKNIQKYLD